MVASDLTALAIERWDWCLMARCGRLLIVSMMLLLVGIPLVGMLFVRTLFVCILLIGMLIVGMLLLLIGMLFMFVRKLFIGKLFIGYKRHLDSFADEQRPVALGGRVQSQLPE
jgi:hypothetical protein